VGLHSDGRLYVAYGPTYKETTALALFTLPELQKRALEGNLQLFDHNEPSKDLKSTKVTRAQATLVCQDSKVSGIFDCFFLSFSNSLVFQNVLIQKKKLIFLVT
jgi:hypothetical protein